MSLKKTLFIGAIALGLAAASIVPDLQIKIEVSERAAQANDGNGGGDD